MATKKEKAYRKKYYQEHKEDIKAYQKERYDRELKAKNVNAAVTSPNSANGSNTRNGGFFSVIGSRDSNKIDANNILAQFSSWIFTCATVNGSSVASQDLRLYATTSGDESTKFLHKNKPISDEFENYLRNESSNSSMKSLARLRRADNVVEIVDHPILDLLDSINENHNNFETFELTSIYLDMIGDSYWYIPRNELGMPQSIHLLQSQYMKVVPGKTKLVKGYLYGKTANLDGKGLLKFRADEIIHFRTPNPNDIYYGRGAAQAVISSINRMNSMDISEQARLDNQGRPDFIVDYKNGKLDSTEIKKIERMWNGAFGGPGKAGKIKVMDEDFGITPLGFKPSEMEYLSGRIWSLKEIAGAFNIPYSILDTTDTKKATSDMANYWYAKNGILPRITRIAEKLNEKLVPLYDPSNRMFLAYDNPIPEDRDVMLKENVGYVTNGIMTVNEARLRLGMAALDGEEYDLPKENGNSDNSDNSDNSEETIIEDE